MRRTFKIFSFLGTSSFAIASLVYWVLQGNGPDGHVFGACFLANEQDRIVRVLRGMFDRGLR